MKILQLCNKPPYPPNDGGTRAMLQMSADLAQAGNEVTVLSVVTSKHSVRLQDIPEELKTKIHFYLVLVDTRIRWLKLVKNLFFSSLPYLAERFVSFAFLEQLKKLLKENSFDVIQFETPYLAYCLQEIRCMSPAPVVYRMHNIESEIWEREARQHGFFVRWYLKLLARRIRVMEMDFIKQCDGLIPISRRDDEKIKEMGIMIPSCVVPYVPSFPSTQESFFCEYPSIFFLGALDWKPNLKGLEWFICKVWPHLQRKYPSLLFHVAGRNPSSAFAKWCRKKGIVFHGEVADAAAFMQRHAIMVVPLFAGSGMRVKIIEGMMHGKAIVSTSLGAEGIPAVHQENILIANTDKDFIEAVSSLVENKEWYERIRKQAYAFAHRWCSNENKIERLMHFYAHDVA